MPFSGNRNSKHSSPPWYTVQPKDGVTTWDLLTPASSLDYLSRSHNTKRGSLNAKDIQDILSKKIAFLSGGKDTRGRPIITIPNVKEPYPHTEYGISTTLKYLSCVLSGKRTEFTILLDVRSSSWNAMKPIIRILQYCLRDRIGLVCIVKPGEFWEKHRASFNFKKYKDRLGFETVLVSSDKLRRYADPSQLTRDFGGTLPYDHQQWVVNRMSYETYVADAENKVHFYENMSSVAKRLDDTETTETGSSTAYSDSGHATEQTLTTSSSADTPPRGRNRSRSSHPNSKEYVYHIPKEDSREENSTPKTINSPVPAPRVRVSPITYAGSPPPQPRIRSRSLPPNQARQDAHARKTTNYVQGPPPYNHIYVVPEPTRPTRKRVTRSHSDYSLQQSTEEEAKETRRAVHRNGPRYLRRRREREDTDTITTSSGLSLSTQTLSSYKSVPDLAKTGLKEKSSAGNAKHVMPNSTIVQGEKLLEQLQTSPDDSGFYVGPIKPVSDEGFLMMENVHKLQNVLHKLDEVNLEKANMKRQKRLKRRKTATGIPEVDGKSDDFYEQLTPTKIEEKLKHVFDWFRGPGEQNLQSNNSFGNSLGEVASLIKKHRSLLSQSIETLRILSDVRPQFERLVKTRRLPDNHGNSFHPVPQWMISIERNLKVVETASKQFQARLRQQGEILQIGFTFHKSTQQLSTCIDKLTKVCRNEVSLLDSLDAIQNQLDELHYLHKDMTKLQQDVLKAANSYLQRFQRHLSENGRKYSQLGLHASQIRESLSHCQFRTKTCNQLTESCKVRLQHVLQLKTAQKDVQESIEWLCDAKRKLKQFHRALGKSAKEVEYLIEQHEHIKMSGKLSYDNGNKQLSAISVLRRCLELSPPHGAPKSPLMGRSQSSGQLLSSSGKVLPSLEDAWDAFIQAWHERRSRLSVAHLFYFNTEQLCKRGSQLVVDLDYAYPNYQEINSSQISFGGRIQPLREAHYTFHDDVDHVMKIGDDLLRDMNFENCDTPSYEPTKGDHVGSAIKVKMNQLRDLRSSVRSKWTRLKEDTGVVSIASGQVSKRRGSKGEPRRWVEAVNESTEWVRMKLVECSPNAFEIGRNLKEAIKWQKKHQDLLFQIKEKDEVVMTLLKKEQRDNLINDSSQHYAMNGSDAGSSEERKMHRAMSNSLSDLWKDLNALLARRHILLNTSVNFYSACNEFGNQLTCLEQYLHWKELPADTATAKSLIHTLEEMHNQMLGSSTACLHRGRELMDMLKTHKANHPDRHKASFGSSCAAIECTLESLVERRNQVEFAYNKRKQELEHALKIRQWEDEVDQVAGWFEVTRTTKLEDNSLGVNQSNTEAMLIHLEQVKENAQERLERAKRLIGRANAELKAFGSDPVAIQSQDLDLVGEGFMKCVDKRKSELGSVVKFYQFVKECETSLLALGEKLELRKFSSDPEVAQAQKENFLTCIKAASDPALNRADAILQRRGERKDGAEGVIDARDRVMEQRNLLLNVIKRYSDDSSRINEMYNLFCKSAQELQDWINTVAVGMLTTNGNLGKTEENASQFLVWHKLLLQDIERKSSELESLVQTANLLLEAGAARSTTVKEHVEEIKSNWAALNKRVSRRIALAEEFTDFLDKANKLFCEIEKLKETVEHDRNCLPQNLTRNHIDELGDDIRSVQTRCVDIMEEANCLNGKLREGVPEDAFDATSAIEGVTELVALLHLIKSELTDTWLSWRYKAGVDKETTAQAKTAEQTINRMMASLENLERSVFLEERVMLGHDADSNQELLDVLEQRQALLESIHKEIEKAVEHSEILGMRIPESPKGSSETNLGESPLRNMVKALLARYHMLDSRLRNYKKALQVAAECILNIAVLQKALIDSERDLIQRQSLRNKTDQTTGVKKQSILSALIRGHDRTKEQMEELMKTISSEFNEIHQIIRRHELGQLPKSGGDEPTLNEFVQELTTSYERWLQLWRTYRDDLVRQRSSSSVLNDIMKHRDGLIPLHKKLRSLQLKISKCQDQEHASLLITEATELNDTAMTAILKWDEFKSGLSATSAREVKDSLQETHEFVYKLSQDSLKSIRSAKILLKFFELTEECESWNDKIKSMISSIRRKAASIKTSKEAKDLGKLFDTSVVEPFEERSNRVLEFASIIVEAERNDLDVSPEDNIESSNDQSLRAVMKNKQNDISASVNTLRYEIDVLNEVLNGVRHKANYPEVTTTLDDESSDYTAVQTCGYGQTTHNVKPYDLSRLYDKNLEKKSENEFPQPPTPEELKLATDNTGTHKQEEKEDTFFDESDSSSSASTSSSDEYLLPHDNETATAFEKDDPILTARKVHSDSDKDESDFSQLLKDFVQVDTSSRSSDLSSALTSSSSFTSISTNSKGQVPPPKPPRKKNQKPLQRGKFWERELDQYESFQFPETAGKYASRETNSYLGQEAVKDASDKVHSLYA